MKLLLAEDDVKLAEYLVRNLKVSGYVVEWADNGVDAEFLALEEEFDCVILDLGLPQKPGLEVLRSWRIQNLETPVLILTARDSWQERVDGLRAGADDYLGKPFKIEELLARLEAILRRRFGRADNSLRLDDIELDIDARTVTITGGESTRLTAIEFRLLRYLMLNPGKILSKTELSEHVYEEEQIKDSNVIEVYVNRLRSILGKERITTHRGQGYRLSV
ncbi:MAG: response regulator transcription factor [Gammaproteobacteria bacterium]|nr:MAG: response regulator transcription factor [Gammaproteobacteria bacterium]UCH39368.1 MAG: response regulator transcription factor [Gammaproteobacteria bacterium]